MRKTEIVEMMAKTSPRITAEWINQASKWMLILCH